MRGHEVIEVIFHSLNERCDLRCPAPGQVEFIIPEATTTDKGHPFLIFCKHHGDALEIALLSRGFCVGRDNRMNLHESNPGFDNDKHGDDN